MRLFLYGFILMASISTAAADSKTDALQIIDRWAKAFTASDVDAIVKLYAPDALFMGTGSKAVVTKPEGIRTYFEAALLNNRPRGATLNSYDSMVLSDNAVLVTGLDTTTRVKDGTPISASGRVTFVVAKRGADWQIVHFHRSAMPQ
ncbi:MULTISPECIES: SgcJ/EcaC family oxidoreductase [unclassified Bradyrhizobium]|uniref:SgcJ/EcaC family oxidoreductase n=1 Tax=unclassified Bradyrhizobium TaxID=2631580 RepID=UPI001BAE4617|nr:MULTISPECIES: SgcJ/EcaC family oxidoreductase [unclassified Bradyrhizobium]MBR1227665.1 SgcJ/EcaC family oxidoreductase [Bradyrhizobium sp. AUGA SZCCT0176]MBR1235136.1 SgcJ/EcaC family oxidoreductase [Bradyrhizobium sp. AUGA SZCCT0182]MBR1282548.1 SgcJ/EcaC family oxidoreductase [Bradyrhizobium sp. AUGA SZCCT0177]MBR1295602.1 SgcJ/EcaC family oxidoreductase [Bradyrhizobium sp. AUGA SZCCT0042]